MQKKKMLIGENQRSIALQTCIPEQFGLMDVISLFQQLFRLYQLRKALGYSLCNVVLASIDNVKLLAQIIHFPASIEKKKKKLTK